MQLLISTVWHTGTNSLRESLGLSGADRGDKWEQIHCCPDTVEKLDQYEIHTTLRDPYEVAISWANRGRIFELEHQQERTWFRQWRCWSQIAPHAAIHPVDELGIRLNAHNDDLGLYESLQNGDLEYYFAHIPLTFVEFALKCTEPYLTDFRVPTHGVKRG